jgi:hypothetical protein
MKQRRCSAALKQGRYEFFSNFFPRFFAENELNEAQY